MTPAAAVAGEPARVVRWRQVECAIAALLEALEEPTNLRDTVRDVERRYGVSLAELIEHARWRAEW